MPKYIRYIVYLFFFPWVMSLLELNLLLLHNCHPENLFPLSSWDPFYPSRSYILLFFFFFLKIPYSFFLGLLSSSTGIYHLRASWERVHENKFGKLPISLNPLHPPHLMDSFSGYWNPNWKPFFLRILKTFLHCLLVSNVSVLNSMTP